jgi:hypothetical protein
MTERMTERMIESMIERYIKKLIENVPISCSGKPEVIDLILDGGIFNGSYQIGSLYFLREMENQKKIKIDKISCCSIGAICAILYHINKLELSIKIYDSTLKHFKKHKKLEIMHSFIDNNIRPLLPVDIHKQLSNKLYICYYDVKKQKKVVRKNYKSIDDLLNVIKRSSFVPFLINGDLVYEKKYVDGMNPYILKCEPNKKILYIDLFGYDKFFYALSVKNEKTNFHRILSGVLDIHLFFIKHSSTQMCSYVNRWSLWEWTRNKVFKYTLEKIIVYLFVFYIWILEFIPEELKDSLIGQIVYKICSIIYESSIEHYCI